jgi:predicted ribosome quality control (RQC) complex YloA/Tae2 family protein
MTSPRVFITENGCEVFVGRNAKENDKLTFTFSHKNDLWFHVKGLPGSHVILRGANIRQSDIQEAANFAAHFSDAKGKKKMHVDYCSVLDVSKPKNAKVGMVMIGNHKTILALPISV